VLVDSRSQTPFHIDFANFQFKDKMDEDWKEFWESERRARKTPADPLNPGEDPDYEYWNYVVVVDHAGSIGREMTEQLLRDHGQQLHITYPFLVKLERRLVPSSGTAGEGADE
jgi:hypothetical protein